MSKGRKKWVPQTACASPAGRKPPNESHVQNASREAAQDCSPQLALSLSKGRKPWVPQAACASPEGAQERPPTKKRKPQPACAPQSLLSEYQFGRGKWDITSQITFPFPSATSGQILALTPLTTIFPFREMPPFDVAPRAREPDHSPTRAAGVCGADTPVRRF